MTVWADTVFANINSGGSYWSFGSYDTNSWYAVIPPYGVREGFGFDSMAAVRQAAATGQNQSAKIYVANRAAGWVLKVRCSSTPVIPGTSAQANGITAHWDGTNLFWRAADGSFYTYVNPTIPSGPGTVELRVVSNIATVIIAGTTVATYDYSSAGITGTYTGFGSDHGNTVYYAEGGDIGGTGTAPAQVTGLTVASVNATRIDLAWTIPANNGQTITGYKIERAPDASGSPGTFTTLVANTAVSYPLTYSDTTVTNGQKWWYRVSAINSIGTGTASTSASATAAPAPAPAFTEDFSKGLKNWTIARWHSQGSNGGNAGYTPSSSNDDGHYDGVLGSHTTPSGPGLFPPYDIFVGSNNYLYVGGGAQNYGDTYLRCAQQIDLTGNGPWKIRLGFIPNPNGDGNAPSSSIGLCGWSTLYLTDKPQASPSMDSDNSHGCIPQHGFAVRLDGDNVYDGTNYHPAPFCLTYNSYAEARVANDGANHLYTISTTAPVEVELTFTRSWLLVTANGVPWATFSWTIPTALTSAWMYLGAHNHATRKYYPYSDSRSAVYTHIEWDGPVITPQYSYAVADALTPTSGAGEVIGDAGAGALIPGPFPGVNVGWTAPTPTLTIPNVPANVSSAKLIMSSWWQTNTPDNNQYYIRYSLNGKPTHDAQTDYQSGSGSFAYAFNVVPSDLVTGDNTLVIQMIGQSGGFSPYLGNVSLLVEAFSTGIIAMGSTVLQTLAIGNTTLQSLALGSTEIWRAPLPPRVATTPTLITVLPAGTPGTGQLTVRWSQPVDNGSAVSDYTVQYRLSPSGTWTPFPHTAQTTRTLTVTGLTAGTAYDVRVAAVNGIGTGGWSNVVTVTTSAVPTAPGAPTALTVGTLTATSVGLNWSAPTSTGGAAISDYLVEYRISPAGTWTPFSHSASPVVSSTVTGVDHQHRLRLPGVSDQRRWHRLAVEHHHCNTDRCSFAR